MAFKHILKIQQCIGLLWNYFKAMFLSYALLILGGGGKTLLREYAVQ